MRQATRTWTIGGIALIASGVFGMLRNGLPSTLGAHQLVGVTTDALFAIGVLLLACGLTREASIVARGPLGVTALVLVAAWPLASTLATGLVGLLEPQGQGPAWTMLGNFALIFPTAVGLIAAVQIARAGVVPSPWRWAPLWALGLHAVAWALPQLTYAAVGLAGIQLYADLFVMLGTLAFLASTLGLGVLTLVLAARRRPKSIEIFRSA